MHRRASERLTTTGKTKKLPKAHLGGLRSEGNLRQYGVLGAILWSEIEFRVSRFLKFF